jgi:hypothetical protein
MIRCNFACICAVSTVALEVLVLVENVSNARSGACEQCRAPEVRTPGDRLGGSLLEGIFAAGRNGGKGLYTNNI